MIIGLLIFVFASSASATVYKWIDEEGTVNFTDDYSRVPLPYRDSTQEINIPKWQPPPPQALLRRTASHPPPVSQVLVREGDFAVRLTQALGLGTSRDEAEAEAMLATAGILPKNGWIADYPVTPDILGEIQDSIPVAADSGRLAMNKDMATKAFQSLTLEQELPITADAGTEEAVALLPPSYGDYEGYPSQEIINNYYDDQGPPVITYYPPPPDFGYLYVWVPYPFWCSGFRFRGFYVLNDFHRSVISNGRNVTVTNHTLDPGTRRMATINPKTRATGNDLLRATFSGGSLASVAAHEQPSQVFTQSSPPGRSNTVRAPAAGRWVGSQSRPVLGKSDRLPPYQRSLGVRGVTPPPRTSISSSPGSNPFSGVQGRGMRSRDSFRGSTRGRKLRSPSIFEPKIKKSSCRSNLPLI